MEGWITFGPRPTSVLDCGILRVIGAGERYNTIQYNTSQKKTAKNGDVKILYTYHEPLLMIPDSFLHSSISNPRQALHLSLHPIPSYLQHHLLAQLHLFSS